ncbi:hypothetical protein QBC42DRAFT_12295 [Cladorrhinum samala]|uniref:Erythromycin esterase n=1 Tax=Cladorrhinum samala TaxID=585594 RepID=A0AAV9HE96_9PEZI|nr:hypothetical protein QBC42DRAFT_12295 [Cladorrhinum samala]
MARRSARLASAQKASQPVVEAPILPTLIERFDAVLSPVQARKKEAALQSIDTALSSPIRAPKTPGDSSPIKPPKSEMHPAKYHATMAPPSSGLRLGFTDIKPVATCDQSLPAAVQTTPSKITVPSSDFTFTFARPKSSATDMELGPEAQRMMEEIRANAEKYKAELIAKREAEQADEANGGRKIVAAKGKAGRFSAAHMNEFKKMDSIENHPSAFRAQLGRTTPLKQGVKRSQSKANLDEQETIRPKQHSSVQPAPAPVSSAAKTRQRVVDEPVSPTKRARQNIEEDATTKRPPSHDSSSIPIPKSAAATGIPRSKSKLASLMTPTKSSLARSATVNKTPSHVSLLRSPSKSTLSGIPRSVTTNCITAAATTATKANAVEKQEEKSVEVKSPISRLEQMKSLFRGGKSAMVKTNTSLPVPSASALGSKTPGPPRLEKDLPPIPMTTPARKLVKRVAFTPETERAALSQNSPSPIKMSQPIQKATRTPLGEVHYPSLDGVIASPENPTSSDGVSYPDLSAAIPPAESPKSAMKKPAPVLEPSVPGTFTFRSDHTISFGGDAPSFGASPGQAGVRTVRPSIMPTENMPGSFPRASSVVSAVTGSPNKENEAPRTVFLALPHGMTNKKRHRVSTDEEEELERMEEERAAKKRREEVPEGEELLAPRLVGANSVKRFTTASRKGSSSNVDGSPRKNQPIPSRMPGTPSPMKKKSGRGGGISLSRLNMLAKPKLRK